MPQKSILTNATVGLQNGQTLVDQISQTFLGSRQSKYKNLFVILGNKKPLKTR